MDQWNRNLSRRRFLQASAGVAGAVALGGSLAQRVAAQDAAPTGTFNWMTWNDHFYKEQLDAITGQVDITPLTTELAGNAEGFVKLKEVGGQLDMISGDALWVPHYHEEGLVDSWDINELEVAKGLFPIARDFEIWTAPDGGYLGYPFGWSRVDIYYNPKYVTEDPDSWAVLLDPKYVGKVMVENQPEEVPAYMGKLAGAPDPYNMTDAELAAATELMRQLKPNILRLAQQNTDVVKALKDEEVWLATGNLGYDWRVKDAGGPEIKVFTPKEGTVGWMDSEMIVTGGANTQLVRPFLELSQQPEYIAENFIRYGRPLFNEEAYKLLVNNGQQERADLFLYNKPETVLELQLKGPGSSTQGSINAFNEVFGVQ